MARNPWLRLGFDAWSLGMEASSVIGLRTLKLAAGGAAAETEAGLMIGEKMRSSWMLGALALTGGLGTSPVGAASKAVSHYRRKVRANRRRLSKG